MPSRVGLHFARDGEKESGLRFEFDGFNMRLKANVDPTFGWRCYRLAVLGLGDAGNRAAMAARIATTNDTASCFEPANVGATLRHCAADPSVPQSSVHCFVFDTLEAAQSACLRLPSCGGVVSNGQPLATPASNRGGNADGMNWHRRHEFRYALRSGDASMLVNNSTERIPNCRMIAGMTAWVRRARAVETIGRPWCVSDPALPLSDAEKAAHARMRKLVEQEGYIDLDEEQLATTLLERE